MRGRTPIIRQATLNGKHIRSTWPAFHFSVVFPHPARAAPGPPSPWGKATSRRGLFFPVRPGPVGVPSTPAACGRHPLQAGEGRGVQHLALRRKRGRLPCVKGAVSRRLTEGSPCCRLGPPHTRQGLWPCHPLPGEGYYTPRHSIKMGTCLAQEASQWVPPGTMRKARFTRLVISRWLVENRASALAAWLNISPAP